MPFQDNPELHALFMRYREVLPDPEGGPDFMPKLWQAIEARRNFALIRWKRWTGAFVSASLALCAVFTLVLFVADRQQPAHLSSYVEVLNDEGATDTLAYAHLPAAAGEEVK